MNQLANARAIKQRFGAVWLFDGLAGSNRRSAVPYRISRVDLARRNR